MSGRTAKFEVLSVGEDESFQMEETELGVKENSYETVPAFRFQPFLVSNTHLTTESYGEVSSMYLTLYLVQASRIPPMDDSKMILHLWSNVKDIPDQKYPCELEISSIGENTYKVTKKAKAQLTVLDGSAHISNIVVPGGYTSIPLPLRILTHLPLKK